MVLGDYFSRHRESDEDPYGLVPVSFSCLEMYLSHLGLHTLNVYSTRSKTKETGVIVPEVHGVNKCLYPHVKPEHQKCKTQPKPARSAPCLVQNIARKLVSKCFKTLCRLATRMGGREAPPEGPKLNLRKQTSTCQGNLPLCWDPSPFPGESLFHPKGKHQANLILKELFESIQVGKH